VKIPTEILEHEFHRSRVYRILADAFNPPMPESVNAFHHLRTHLNLLESEAEDPVTRLLEALKGPLDLETLQVDFARLFVGPFLLLAPPYGSVYLNAERKLMGDSTMDVLGYYRDLGLDTDSNFKEAPDHICAELEFMHALVCRQAEALRTDDGEGLIDSLRRQHLFLGNHLGVWVPDFSARVLENADTRFYSTLAEATKIFIDEERLALDIQVEEGSVHAVF